MHKDIYLCSFSIKIVKIKAMQRYHSHIHDWFQQLADQAQDAVF